MPTVSPQSQIKSTSMLKPKSFSNLNTTAEVISNITD